MMMVVHLLLQGVLQPLLCTIGLLLSPIAAAVIAAWAVARKSLRHAWDITIFELVIRKRARVPAGDSFVARRIGGPGMAGNFFYQIKTEQALVASLVSHHHLLLSESSSSTSLFSSLS